MTPAHASSSTSPSATMGPFALGTMIASGWSFEPAAAAIALLDGLGLGRRADRGGLAAEEEAAVDVAIEEYAVETDAGLSSSRP
jgi:hypothetical protein